MNSILKLREIYEKYNKQFLKLAIDVLESTKKEDTNLNYKDINDFIFDNVLGDIHLSKYRSKKPFNLVHVDIIPDDYMNDLQEEDEYDHEKFGKREKKDADRIYNEELATDFWENIMIYGGQREYMDMINNIINEVKNINEIAACKMSNGNIY